MSKKRTPAQSDIDAHDMLVTLQEMLRDVVDQIAMVTKRLRAAQKMLDATSSRRVARSAARKKDVKRYNDEPGFTS